MRQVAVILLLFELWAAASLSTSDAAAFEESAPMVALVGRGLLQRTLNCRAVHKACSSCRMTRIPGTRRTDLVCSVCDVGWRLRRDGKSKTCDCAPGFAMTGPVSDQTSTCSSCPLGKYCAGGDATNPSSSASQCPAGLATTYQGAKSAAQCFTKPGYGRQYARGSTGVLALSGVACPIGTYNTGSNTAGCFRCNPGLTTQQEGSTSITDCVAPPGSYYDRGIGRLCPQGTYSDIYSGVSNTTYCTPCATGVTTPTEGSNSSGACSLAQPGYYMSGEGQADLCPVNTYNGQISNATSCTPCPYDLRTQSPGATGAAQCLAPPGYELRDGAAAISECDIGYYKQDWNRNNCTACGQGVITASTASIGRDACLVPAGWGLVSVLPLVAAPCTNNSYGINENRPVSSIVRCVSCSSNMYTLDVLAGSLLPDGTGYTDETSCKVSPGWGTTQSNIVEQCQRGYFNVGLNRSPCTECPIGYTTLEVGSTNSSACVIQPGWTFDSNLGLPVSCSVGTYSAGGTADNPTAECVACPAGTTTQTDESTSIDDCHVCQAGYGGDGCQLCPYNTWSSGNLAAGTPCQPCASGSVSSTGATSPEECQAAMQLPVRDIFQLSNDSYWETVSADSVAACSLACSSSSSCIQYRWGQGITPPCQVLNEYTGTELPTQRIAIKLQYTSAYAVYHVPAVLNLGSLVETLPDQHTMSQCLLACLQRNACEIVSFPTDAEYGTCSMWQSELDADYVSMFHVGGSKITTL